jgi:hypothetical protein
MAVVLGQLQAVIKMVLGRLFKVAIALYRSTFA